MVVNSLVKENGLISLQGCSQNTSCKYLDTFSEGPVAHSILQIGLMVSESHLLSFTVAISNGVYSMPLSYLIDTL